MPAYIPARKAVVTRRYNLKYGMLAGDDERIQRLQKDYELVQRVLDLSKEKSFSEVSEVTGVNLSTLRDWVSGRKLPRSMRLNSANSNKINKQKLAESLDFIYLLGVYQPRVQKITEKLFVESKHDWLEEKVFDCMHDVFGDTHSQYALFQSKDLMKCIREITDDNGSLPESLFYPKENACRSDVERVYIQGFLDSRASVTCQKRVLKCSGGIRQKPVIFAHVRNSSLLEKIKGLLAKHSINSSYITDKRDGRRSLCINELSSVKICRLYLSDSPKKEKLSEFMEYHEDMIKNDLFGRSSKEIQRSKQEKEKNIAKVGSSMPRVFRSSRKRREFNKQVFKVYR